MTAFFAMVTAEPKVSDVASGALALDFEALGIRFGGRQYGRSRAAFNHDESQWLYRAATGGSQVFDLASKKG